MNEKNVLDILESAEKNGVDLSLFGDFKPTIHFQEEKNDLSKPTIAYIHTGGTLAMVPSIKRDKALSFEGAIDIEKTIELCDALSNIKSRYNLMGIHLSNLDSKDVDANLWTALAATIKSIYTQVDGVVIGHGTHTLEYTAAAISYALRNVSIPIVLTASQIPLAGFPGSDGFSNLTGAMEIAAFGDIGEVMVYAHGEIHRATRVKKENDKRLNVFSSPVLGPIGYFTAAGIEPKLDVRRRGFKKKHELIFQPLFSSSVSTLRLNPGESEISIKHLIDTKKNLGIILEAYGSAAIPKSWVPPLSEHVKSGHPIFLSSSCGQSGVSQGMEEHDEDAIAVKKAGIMHVADMTTPAACVKLMNIMGMISETESKLKKLELVKEEMLEKSYAGELTLGRGEVDF